MARTKEFKIHKDKARVNGNPAQVNARVLRERKDTKNQIAHDVSAIKGKPALNQAKPSKHNKKAPTTIGPKSPSQDRTSLPAEELLDTSSDSPLDHLPMRLVNPRKKAIQSSPKLESPAHKTHSRQTSDPGKMQYWQSIDAYELKFEDV